MSGVSNDPAIVFLRYWVQFKSAAAQDSINVYAPTHPGRKLHTIACLKSNELVSTQITVKHQAAAGSRHIFSLHVIGEGQSILVKTRDS